MMPMAHLVYGVDPELGPRILRILSDQGPQSDLDLLRLTGSPYLTSVVMTCFDLEKQDQVQSSREFRKLPVWQITEQGRRHIAAPAIPLLQTGGSL